MQQNLPNLVIGAIRGYTFSDLAPFVISLKRSNFRGDLVLLWNSVDESTRRELESHGVQLVHFSYRGGGSINSWSRFWPWLRPLLRLPVGDSVRSRVYRKILNLAFVRYLHTLDYLRANQGRYQNILITDVRDVIFQDDPFRDPLPGDIVAFLEEPFVRYGKEPMNDGWIIENYGATCFKLLNGQRISCCGTVMGSAPGMIEYLSAFASEIIRLRSVAHGADTSVHNVLIRKRMAGQITIVDNFEGAVGTCHADSNRVASRPPVLDTAGKPVPVLHQYDRHPEFMKGLNY